METLHTGGREYEVVLLTCECEVRELTGLFETVAREQGWKPEGSLRHRCDTSVYFALKRGPDTVGGLKHTPGRGTLPCSRIWPELDLAGRTDIAHVPILALDPRHRGSGGTFWLLCVEMWRYCMEKAIARLYLEVTPRTLRLYRRIGWPLEVAGPLRRHWGEDCYLCSMDVGELADVCIGRAKCSHTYRAIVRQGLRLPEGSGLTGRAK